MIEHHFQHNNLDIYTGWVPASSHYFLVIKDREEDKLFFSNTWLENPALSVQDVLGLLDRMSIPYPETLANNLSVLDDNPRSIV